MNIARYNIASFFSRQKPLQLDGVSLGLESQSIRYLIHIFKPFLQASESRKLQSHWLFQIHILSLRFTDNELLPQRKHGHLIKDNLETFGG